MLNIMDIERDVKRVSSRIYRIASWLFDRASFVLIGSLIFGALATVLIVWMGIVKEHHWDLAREHSQERIAELNKDTARLSVEAESARAAIAEANARAAEATQKAEEANLERVRLEEKLAPRRLSQEQISLLVSELKCKIP